MGIRTGEELLQVAEAVPVRVAIGCGIGIVRNIDEIRVEISIYNDGSLASDQIFIDRIFIVIEIGQNDVDHRKMEKKFRFSMYI